MFILEPNAAQAAAAVRAVAQVARAAENGIENAHRVFTETEHTQRDRAAGWAPTP